MNPRTTLILALIAVVVSTLAWRSIRDSRPNYITGDERPFSFSIHSVSSLEVQRPAQPKIRIEKAELGWRLVAPVEDQGRYAAIEDLLVLLRDLQLHGDGPENLAKIGLSSVASQDSIQVQIETPSRSYSLTLGDDHPSLPRVHALVDGKSVLVAQQVRDGLRDFKFAELRDDAVCGMAPSRVGRIRLERPGQPPEEALEVVRVGANWEIRSPLVADADALAVEDWLQRIAHWAAVGYLDVGPDADSDATLGLVTPRAILQLESRDGDLKTVSIGNQKPIEYRGNILQNTVAVRASGRGSPLVAAGVVAEELLSFAPARLLSPFLFRLDDPKTKLLQISRGKYGSVEVDQNPAGGWRIDWAGSPQSVAAEASRIEDLLAELRDLRVSTRFMGDRSELQRWGFDVPQLELQLTSAQGEEERVIVGSAVADQPGDYYVWNLRSPSFAIVTLSQLDELLQAPFSLRDRRVTVLNSSELLRFRITDGSGREALLAKSQRLCN